MIAWTITGLQSAFSKVDSYLAMLSVGSLAQTVLALLREWNDEKPEQKSVGGLDIDVRLDERLEKQAQKQARKYHHMTLPTP